VEEIGLPLPGNGTFLMASPMLILGTAQINPQYGVTRQTPALAPGNDFEDLLNGGRNLGIEALDTASAYTGAHALIQQN